jgi:hypothetical protein
VIKQLIRVKAIYIGKQGNYNHKGTVPRKVTIRGQFTRMAGFPGAAELPLICKYATAAYFKLPIVFIRLFLIISFAFSCKNSGEYQDNNQYDDYYPNPVEWPASKAQKTASLVLRH